MPDITMCASEQCPKRYKCYRHTAEPTPDIQSWSVFYRAGQECQYYWEVSK